MSQNPVVLKPGKEIPLLRKHPWIFSGAVATLPNFTDGDILPIHSSEKKHLGWGMFNRQSNIIGRMLSFSPEIQTDTLVRDAIEEAYQLRQRWISDTTNAYRVVNAEGDGLPGLIVDKYADYLVIQVHTLGMERQKQIIVDKLTQLFNPKGIFEKSTGTSRRREGLTDITGCIFGNIPLKVLIKENTHSFYVDILEGQKTGFFLDQRPMRQRIQELAKGKRLLNCFCYTGGFSAYALAGGAKWIDSVDSSAKAIQLTNENLALNSTTDDIHWASYTEDVFSYIRQSPLDYDIIILDPPAFAKKQQDIKNACKGYRDLNKMVMQKAKPGTLLLTCSCSQPINDEQFLQTLFEAALEANKRVQILEKQRHGIDHPLNIFHPEGSYLKGYLLKI